MIIMSRKLIKVTFEYKNTIETLEGTQAQKWLDTCNSQVLMGWVHGNSFPKFNWKVQKK